MAGIDIAIPELQTTLHVPKYKEIALIGEQNFFTAVQFLCLDKEMLVQDKSLLSSLSNFQVLMKVLEQSQDKDKKNAIIMLLKLLFPEYVAQITKNSIILTKVEEDVTVLIDNNNFAMFQDILKVVLCVDSIYQGENIIYNPGNDKAKEIAAKLMRGRQKAVAIKNKGNTESVLTRYVSILTIGTNTMSLNDCINLNLFQMFNLMERYNAFVEWDVDLRVRLAGGKPNKQVESWMRNLHSRN